MRLQVIDIETTGETLPTRGNQRRAYVSKSLPAHACNSFLTFVVAQVKKAVEGCDDDLLVSHTSRHAPAFHPLVTTLIEPDGHGNCRLNARG